MARRGRRRREKPQPEETPTEEDFGGVEAEAEDPERVAALEEAQKEFVAILEEFEALDAANPEHTKAYVKDLFERTYQKDQEIQGLGGEPYQEDIAEYADMFIKGWDQAQIRARKTPGEQEAERKAAQRSGRSGRTRRESGLASKLLNHFTGGEEEEEAEVVETGRRASTRRTPRKRGRRRT